VMEYDVFENLDLSMALNRIRQNDPLLVALEYGRSDGLI
jgi:hypothetical protein